jgi:broad specificity phosphatase PhoE
MSMTRVILARHGNTFAAKDRPVWVGSRTDLPLVEKGRMQAEAIGQALHSKGIVLTGILCGPLQRTRDTARIAAEQTQLDPRRVVIDDRLKEIDYGEWEGLTNDEIIASGDGEELAEWNKSARFPIGRGWKPVEGQVTADVNFILAEMPPAATIMIVTSNGILRFFGGAAVNAKEIGDSKVATGHVCVMETDSNGDWRVVQWNQPPDLLAIKG